MSELVFDALSTLSNAQFFNAIDKSEQASLVEESATELPDTQFAAPIIGALAEIKTEKPKSYRNDSLFNVFAVRKEVKSFITPPCGDELPIDEMNDDDDMPNKEGVANYRENDKAPAANR